MSFNLIFHWILWHYFSPVWPSNHLSPDYIFCRSLSLKPDFSIWACTKTNRCPILSTRYSLMCNVYTGYYGRSETEHGLCACTVDNPLAKARRLSLRTGAQTMLYLSHVISQVRISVEVTGPGRRILSRVNDHVFMTKASHEVTQDCTALMLAHASRRPFPPHSSLSIAWGALPHVYTVELRWLEHRWLVYHDCFELVLEPLGKNLIAADWG